jgi:hypothetical protein
MSKAKKFIIKKPIASFDINSLNKILFKDKVLLFLAKNNDFETIEDLKINDEYIKSLCDDEEKDELEYFLSSTHFVDWKHVRNGKKAYIFEPEIEYYRINPLLIKPENVPLLNISNLEIFYNWLPPVRFRIDRKFNISHFEFQAFFKAIDLCDQLRKALKDPIFKNKLWKIFKEFSRRKNILI